MYQIIIQGLGLRLFCLAKAKKVHVMTSFTQADFTV